MKGRGKRTKEGGKGDEKKGSLHWGEMSRKGKREGRGKRERRGRRKRHRRTERRKDRRLSLIHI